MLHSLINTHSRLNLQVVSLTFHDFNLEAHSQCRYDYVAVYNGLDENSPLQGRYCGASVPPCPFGVWTNVCLACAQRLMRNAIR